MNKLFYVISAASIALCFGATTSSAQGESCSGDACDDVSFTSRNGCFVIANHGSDRVKVTMGNFAWRLERGEERVLTNPFPPNECLTMIIGEVKAEKQ